jgi:hypothetical protein
MNLPSLLIGAACTLTVGACSPAGPPAARTALDCPAVEGELTRTAIAPDRRSCTYAARDGGDVVLRLVDTNGDPRAALSAIEASLIGPVDTSSETVQGGQPAPDSEAGGNTRVDLPGIHIVAGDDKADVRIGAITVKAQNNAATVRIFTDQRLKGEAFSREKRGVRATFIHAGDEPTDGRHLVGYEAGGPKAGPLTVAIVRSAPGDSDEQDIGRDVKRLVDRNAGV